MIRRGYSSHGAAIHRAVEKGKSYNPDVEIDELTNILALLKNKKEVLCKTF
jgi:hypothetical protein